MDCVVELLKMLVNCPMTITNYRIQMTTTTTTTKLAMVQPVEPVILVLTTMLAVPIEVVPLDPSLFYI